MINEARIYLAAQRGCTQSDWYRSFSTFNFGEYFDENRKPFGNILACNDDTLAAGSKIAFQPPENTSILLLPVVGGVYYSISGSAKIWIEAGHALWLFIREDEELEISNPFETHPVNFLHIWLPGSASASQLTQEIPFDIEQNKNELQALIVNNKPVGYLGKFDGRKEGTCKVKNPGQGAFVFVIEGAFEVQNRLLQYRDGLALWNLKEVEFEALSNEAVLLLIEN